MHADHWLGPLAPVYGAVTGGEGEMVRRGWLKRRRAEESGDQRGELSAGGAGKTPMVLLLARLLRGADMR